MSRIDASVIVATNPHDGDLRRVLEGYALQKGMQGGFEVVVVDDGSREDVAGACARSASAAPALQVRCLRSATRGRAAANNAGARAAAADLLIFVADDFIPGPTLVRAHVEFHRSLVGPAVGIGPARFTASCRDDAFARWLEDSGRLFGVPFRTAAPEWTRDFFYVGNASLARDLCERVGGFDETFEHDLLDDFEFGLRLRSHDVRTHLLPKALAWHDHAVTLAERWLAMHRSGAAARRYDRATPGTRPWSAIASQPVAALARRVEHAARGDVAGERTDGYFRALMDLAFVQGYEGNPSAPPASRADASGDLRAPPCE